MNNQLFDIYSLSLKLLLTLADIILPHYNYTVNG